MSNLEALSHYIHSFNEIKQLLDVYHHNFQNEIFIKQSFEDNRKEYQRGELFYNQLVESINSLNSILDKEHEIIEFFIKCKENKKKSLEQKNSLITLLLELKKDFSTEEECITKPEESENERNKKECEELLKEITEKEESMKKIKEDIEKEKKEMLSIKVELEELMRELKKERNEFNEKKSEYIQKNEIYNYIPNIKYNLLNHQIKQLEEWTSLKCSDVLFDSDRDNWKERTSVFDSKIIGNKQLVFLIEDEDGEKFGYYLNSEIIDNYISTMKTDQKSFLFNLESNGRLSEAMKFEIKDKYKGGYKLCDKSQYWLIELGDIRLFKENNKNDSHCYQNDDIFDYHGIDKALCGKKEFYNSFIPKRIVVIQMQ